MSRVLNTGLEQSYVRQTIIALPEKLSLADSVDGAQGGNRLLRSEQKTAEKYGLANTCIYIGYYHVCCGRLCYVLWGELV